MKQDFSAGKAGYQTRRRERPKLTPNPKARLRDQLHEVMRFLHFSERTEETYWQWTVRFLKFQRKPIGRTKEATPHPQSRGTPSPPAPLPIGLGEGSVGPVEAEREGSPGAHGVTRPTHEGWRHPKDLGAAEVNAFLSHLAAELNVAAATQNQALNALVFLYGEVLPRKALRATRFLGKVYSCSTFTCCNRNPTTGFTSGSRRICGGG